MARGALPPPWTVGKQLSTITEAVVELGIRKSGPHTKA